VITLGRMPTRVRLLILCVLALLLWPPSRAEAAKPKRKAVTSPVGYHVTIPEPTTRYVHVRVSLVDAPNDQTTLAMPAWIPGSYLIRDFGKHVYDVVARDLDGRELKVTRIDKQSWTVANDRRGFVVEYRVFAGELSVRTSYVDDRFALLNGAGLFMYVDNHTARAAELELSPPAGWDVHTALDPGAEESRGAAKGQVDPMTNASAGVWRFSAPSYDELIDSPLLLGAAEVRRFEVVGKPIELVMIAPGGCNVNLDRAAADAEQIVRAFARTLNGLPFERYSFLLVGDEVGGGGLEHHDSTAMIVRPWSFTNAGGYAGLQRLMAHEFFHVWNVKRIHDEVLGPFDYSKESYSELLWFHEGLTETMETRALLRAGLISPADYLGQLAAAWSSYRRKPGRNATAIAELSRDAWIKSYKPEANHAETTISYYEKGNLIGVCLDLSLRLRARANRTNGSIEGLFRRLWALRDPNSGRAAIDIEDIIAAASAEAGEDMRWFFDRYVYGTEELPLPELLERAGFEVGKAEVGGDDPRTRVWSGMSGAATVNAIEPDSPAAAAGLMLGDELIAVEGSRVESVSEANERLADLGVGATASVSLFRRDRLETRELTTRENPHLVWGFAPPEQAGDAELAQLRQLWLLEHLVR
jgi:predicted metalloprotease with PDZ domain